MEHEKTEECSGPRFEPALWRQRKLFACQTLISSAVTSVIDFGCGEGALTSTLINYYDENNPITRVAAVDISRECLDQAIETCQPQILDLGDHARPFELSLHFFRGSVDAADERLMGYEGLACMEVVEHLDPPVLAGFWKVVLAIYRPKVVIVSTPNAEFNIHFTNLRYGTPESTFRHWDHRFEWTRQEFQQWCTEAAELYGYSVEFSGVGTIDEKEPLEGFCSQIAVLKRLETCAPVTSQSHDQALSTPYEFIETIEYPFYNVEHSEDELLAFLHDRIALIRPLPPSQRTDDNDNDDDDDSEEEKSREVISGQVEGIKAVVAETQQEPPPPSPPPPPSHQQDQRQTQEPDHGCLSVTRLWTEYQVQQRFKTRSRLIELLGLSPLVRLSEDQSQILFDVTDPFWTEFERRYEERMANGRDGEDDEDDYSQYEEDDADWSSQDQEGRWSRLSESESGHHPHHSDDVGEGHQKRDAVQAHDGAEEEASWLIPSEGNSYCSSGGGDDGWGAPGDEAWETHSDWKENSGW
ncbi:Small RNA 2'-O-methyltransferase [Actinomortierella ambigua]|nr:Small RNA 2'-O-methyltransferase [Actinomortierella ambigua]